MPLLTHSSVTPGAEKVIPEHSDQREVQFQHKLFHRRNQLLLAEVGFFSGISSIQGLCQKIFVLNLEC